eukprot:TRINITY_DN38302_c0_g1_i1.p1 TRINITY_DN38302_c0_g1~~TRINITY_DN38302_c0_g1_i1.p1  ORF type:complete len:359 (-),score=85.15 TRINITY_DN38302_c0_g1_i1:50-1126(-)
MAAGAKTAASEGRGAIASAADACEEHDAACDGTCGGLLPILAVTSDNYAPVFNFWRASLDALRYPASRLHVVQLGALKPPFGYCTDSWRAAIDRQLAEVVAWIRGHLGEYFLHTDTDIQFFPRFLGAQKDWLRRMRMENLDMLFMRERTQVFAEQRIGEVNAGFYVVHCNERTLRFWEEVVVRELRHPKMSGPPPYTDQYHVNCLLAYKAGAVPQVGAFGVRWGTVPDIDCIWSIPESPLELECAAFHHAVNTPDKPSLLREVRALVLAKQPLQQFALVASAASREDAGALRCAAASAAQPSGASVRQLTAAAWERVGARCARPGYRSEEPLLLRLGGQASAEVMRPPNDGDEWEPVL